jgi:hypothetical protein
VRKSLFLALAAGLLTTVMTAPAHADSAAYRDTTNDVQVLRFDEQTDFDHPAYSPSSTPNGDVVVSRFTHDRDAVTLYVRYREIYVPRLASSWLFDLQGSNHRRRSVELVATSDTVGGRAVMTGGRCKVASKINYVTNSVKVRFPRRCLGNPTYVRVSGLTYTVSINTQAAYIYYDDLLRNGGSPQQAGMTRTRWIKAS